MWVFCFSSFFGNIFVMIWRITSETKNNVQLVQAIFIGNLAFSDMLMGFYMIFLAIADAYYGDEFYKISNVWRNSILCRFAGFLVLVSGETSLILLTFITIDRFLVCVFPFSSNHFHRFSATVAVSATWVVTIIMSVLASVFADSDGDFYSLSDVCIGLPFVTRPGGYEIRSNAVKGLISSKSFDLPISLNESISWYFSISLFLGLNFLLSNFIFVLYVVIFITVRKTSRAAQTSPNIKREMMMAIRMTAVVITNCLCWLPVIILGILSQSGVISISLELFVWTVVFILPLNASLNPYLYTISMLIGD